MRRKIIIILTFFSFSCYAQNLSLSLSDAINLALNNNQTIKQYEAKLKQKEYDYLASYGNFLPAINFDFSYSHLNEEMGIDLNPIRELIISLQSSNQVELTNISGILSGNPPMNQNQKEIIKQQTSAYLNNLIPPFYQTFKKQNYKSGAFLVTQPIFVGGKLLAARNASLSEKNSANNELEKVKNEVIYQTVDSYLKVLLLKEIVKTRKEVLEGMIQHRTNANRLFQEGIIANYHLLRAEVAVSEAEKNLLNDENNLSLAIESFKNITNISSISADDFLDTLCYKVFSDSLSSMLNKAMNNQPILKITEDKKELAKQNFNAVRSSFLPTVAAFGKYEVYPEYLSSLEPRWVIGIQMKYNLFNGFKDYLKLQNAKYLEEEVAFAENDIRKKIELWVTKSYLEMINYKTQYEKLNSTLKLAEENLRMNEKRFETGMSTSLEVIDARLSLERVKIDRLLSLYQYYNSMVNLLLAAGNPQEILHIWSN